MISVQHRWTSFYSQVSSNIQGKLKAVFCPISGFNTTTNKLKANRRRKKKIIEEATQVSGFYMLGLCGPYDCKVAIL